MINKRYLKKEIRRLTSNYTDLIVDLQKLDIETLSKKQVLVLRSCMHYLLGFRSAIKKEECKIKTDNELSEFAKMSSDALEGIRETIRRVVEDGEFDD